MILIYYCHVGTVAIDSEIVTKRIVKLSFMQVLAGIGSEYPLL